MPTKNKLNFQNEIEKPKRKTEDETEQRYQNFHISREKLTMDREIMDREIIAAVFNNTEENLNIHQEVANIEE